MGRKFDKDDVLKFIYGELEPEEHAAFVEALCKDDTLFELYESMKEVQDELVTVQLEPSSVSVNRVLGYARKSTHERIGGSLLEPGKKLINVYHLVSVLMVVITSLTILLAVSSYEDARKGQPKWVKSNLEWEGPALKERLKFVRHQLDQVLEQQEAISPVYHNTYRLLNTGLSAPVKGRAKLLILK